MTEKFEIPDTVREMAESSVDQARQAYSQFIDVATRSQDMMQRSSGVMTQSAIDIQAKAMRYAQQNIEASFALATELARARDMREYFEIQTRHAQRQMQTYTEQAQELARLMADAAQKAQPRP